MKVIERSDAKASLAEYADQAIEEPVVITVDGKPMAALVKIENADLETVSLTTNLEFLTIIEQSRKRQKKEGGISSQEMRRRLEINE